MQLQRIRYTISTHVSSQRYFSIQFQSSVTDRFDIRPMTKYLFNDKFSVYSVLSFTKKFQRVFLPILINILLNDTFCNFKISYTYIHYPGLNHVLKYGGVLPFTWIISFLWRNHLVVKALDSLSRGPGLKTSAWFQCRLSFSSCRG